jgi:hypothetical protein
MTSRGPIGKREAFRYVCCARGSNLSHRKTYRTIGRIVESSEPTIGGRKAPGRGWGLKGDIDSKHCSYFLHKVHFKKNLI